MNYALNRRRFLTAAAASGLCPGLASAVDPPKPAKILDIHVHLFGTGDSGSGCRLSKTTTDGQTFKLLSAHFNLEKRAKTKDEAYVLALAEQVENSGLDKAVILAQDAVYDRSGKPDWSHTHFYIPNDYLLKTVARYPKRMIPCVSINPDRADAIEELERCREKGAYVLKIHPPTQGVDLADKKHTKFFRRCADLKVVVMVHTGHEHSAPVMNVALADPRKVELALDQGCTVVACHCGTGGQADKPDMLPSFFEMVRKHKNLWGDTAVLGSAGRIRDFQRLLADAPSRERLLHGSDFPFPPFPLGHASTIGMKKALELQPMSNWIGQDFRLKEALGIGRQSAERAYRLVGESTV